MPVDAPADHANRLPAPQFLTEWTMLASVDHIVLTTADLERCLDFYTRVLGMQVERYAAGRIALRFGPHKFNVHPPEFHAGIKARVPTPGSLDLCFLADRT